ncbi:MAG: hypothetical protein KC457_34125, partial [Myxococcales bacterium]|nr:hypothetical protein [Myxococcales bacterium]
MKSEIIINLVTPLELATSDWGDRILRALVAKAPTLTPAKYGEHMPLAYDYVPGEDLLRESWSWPFSWKSRSAWSEGAVWPQRCGRPQHATVVLRAVEGRKLDPKRMVG